MEPEQGDAIYARRMGNRSFAWYVIDSGLDSHSGYLRDLKRLGDLRHLTALGDTRSASRSLRQLRLALDHCRSRKPGGPDR